MSGHSNQHPAPQTPANPRPVTDDATASSSQVQQSASRDYQENNKNGDR